ncbi:hypothetical protein LTS15_007770 [Exophiala xenobiotica]|nr:hypothetical protein LTS15_007770 [Exophiala xenobiotica]
MTEEEFFCLPDIPDSCPFTISRLLTPSGEASASWLIREHDQYGEYPHIYAKVCKSPPRQQEDDDGVGLEKQQAASHRVIILSDTGCATETLNTKLQRCDADGLNEIYYTPRGEPRRWNIRTFLEHTINPGGRAPYVVIATHCHYDHILGIGKLMMNTPPRPPPPARMRFSPKTRHMSQEELHRLATTTPITVLTSSHDKSFVTPYSNLQRHSLSSSVGVHAPRYAITWAEDLSEVQWHFSESSGTSEDSISVSTAAAAAAAAAPIPSLSMSTSISSRITVLHTPGHTPDSMSWYDADLALLCVGDSFYLKETHETRKAPWGPEPAMPTMFDVESDLADLWRSTARLLLFVRARNAELERNEIEIKTKTETEHLSDPCSGTLLRQPNNAKTRTRHDQTRNWNCNWSWKSTSRQDQTGFDHPHLHPQQNEQEMGRLLPLPEASFQHARDTATEHDVEDDDDWILVDLVAQGPCSSSSFSSSSRSSASPPPPQPPRVRLAAAHTTATRVDAEAAILSFREFILRILRDEVPKQRVEDGYRGEERWVFDFALGSQASASQEGQQQQDNTSTPEKCDIDIDIDIEIQNGNGNGHLRGGHRFQYLHSYSVLAPLQVIELGRRKIPRESWTSG